MVVRRDLPDAAELTSAYVEVNSTPLPIADGWRRGEPILMFGYPANAISRKLLVVTSGVIGGDGVKRTGGDFLLLDARGADGSSGGPVVNLSGEVVGIIEGGLAPFEYAVDLTKE